jgi:hypothetical protein
MHHKEQHSDGLLIQKWREKALSKSGASVTNKSLLTLTPDSSGDANIKIFFFFLSMIWEINWSVCFYQLHQI